MFYPATRSEALQRLDQFAPAMGRDYAQRRNYDTGPGPRRDVSQLSPFIARRMITEAEAVKAALRHHSLPASEKFVQEVLWRTYFKGWLEHRPTVWQAYRSGLRQDLAAASDGRWQQAIAGETGIPAFDAWALELVDTGYLHNHARMWFASIWIFTLGLPWRIGADFFLRHLLDGDAAANTLGWRWVAGLHTPGKNYAARSANIAKYTGRRFAETSGLAINPFPLEEGGLPPRTPLRQPAPIQSAPTLHLITSEDLSPNLPENLDIRGMAVLNLADHRSLLPIGKTLETFHNAALADAETRYKAQSLETNTAEAVINRARSIGATQITTAFRHQGWVQDWFAAAAPKFKAAGLTLSEHQRPWDKAFHPFAKSGFFALKKKIPATLGTLGIGPQAMPLFEGAGPAP